MKNNRIISAFLCLIMVLCLIPSGIVTASNDSITIIACTDFQHKLGHSSGQAQMQEILDALADEGITSADGFFATGDYDVNYSSSAQGIAAIKETMKNIVDQNMVFVKGNHDDIGTEGLSPSGNNDPDSGDYGVFVINENDYMWYNKDRETIKQTSGSLAAYLSEKLAAEYDKPIFVLSHLPLHYNMRTHGQGDGEHANYIFDVLNKAGEQGLNIIFMFGHNHSGGWDDYLGGASVYLKKGDQMHVAVNSRTDFKTETINFTYLNAGYTGYYSTADGADNAMTMTVLEISDNGVEIARYSKDGLHNLKSAGVRNTDKGETMYDPDTTVYTSPQTVALGDVIDTTSINPINPATGEQYTRVTSVSDLKNGGKYLLAYNGSTDYLMPPVTITKECTDGETRKGLKLELFDRGNEDTFFGEYTDKIWTFTKSSTSWILSGNGNQLKLSNDGASMTSSGNKFTVGGSKDAFTFDGGMYNMYYNTNNIIVGNGKNSASFYIYEQNGCTVTALNGTSSKTLAKTGEIITLTANVPAGKEFDKWVVIKGDVKLDDEESTTTTFTMSDTEVRVKAVYTETAPACTLGDANNDGSIDVSDVVMIIEYIGTLAIGEELDTNKFPGGTFPGGEASALLTADTTIDISDAVLLVEYIGTISIGEELDPDKFPGGTFPGPNNR